ncbi:ATP-binding protein [Priestia abyssalis]|uniref:ATP-binding protein n=1 Tax=Priestia abyssalis TaxID=1221450 RepID=UPI001472F11A|nr:ATP-binding protein [Priestia abyssalis]
MKLEKVILENFRSYKERVSVDMDDLTAFIGKNDIGKSTILEALEIFFNNEIVKIGQDDLCVQSTDTKVRIGCVFSDLPTNPISIDTTAITTLQQEYLLNEQNQLEVHKVFDCSKKTVPHEVFLVANYPSEHSASDLLDLTNAQLKRRITDLGIEETGIDLRSNVSMRQAIYKSFEDLKLELREIPVTKGDAKSVWEKLKHQLPMYSLFQSDRPSLDGDSEVQDPMKLAIKEALTTVEEELTKIKETVKRKALEVAANTVEKLKDMDETLAKQLTPHFAEEPKWDKVFKMSLDGDNDIPINKRGSGVRRLILLNFFRAEAERKLSESGSRSVIYAIEEPETAQHPSNQILLADALKALSQNDKTQVILTTHVPGFAGLLPTESLRYIKEGTSGKEVQNAAEGDFVINEIAEALGVLPPPIDENVKVAVFVEGVHDVECLKTLSEIISRHNQAVISLSGSSKILVLPSGGSTLKGWVENQYLKALGIPEVHIYDRDEKIPPKYQKWCDKINARGDGSVAFITQKREMENYIHPAAIKAVLDVDIVFTPECDVPKLISSLIEPNEGTIKKLLNNEVVKLMTYEQICEMDGQKEIEHWLETISNFCLESVSNS